MSKLFLHNLSLVLAHSIQYEVNQEWEPVRGATGFNFSANEGQTSTSSTASEAFQRQGTTDTGAQWTLPTWLSSLIQTTTGQNQMPQGLQNLDWSFITNLLNQDPSQFYGSGQLNNVLNLDATNYNGASSLDNIIARNPYSQDYENATRGLYDRQFGIARSNAMSGPANVRGGQARVGFDLADTGTQQSLNRFREVRQTADKEAGIVEQATHMANVIESMRRSSSMQAQQLGQAGEHTRTEEGISGSGLAGRSRAQNSANLQLAAELLGLKEQQVKENLAGQGQQIQSSQGQSFGMGGGVGTGQCCFIFLQSLNGELPLYVRWGRDDFQTPNRRNGYVWMSKWLVPWMQRSQRITSLVNWVMIRPFMVWGRSLYCHPRPFYKIMLAPVCWGWFTLWSLIGYAIRFYHSKNIR